MFVGAEVVNAFNDDQQSRGVQFDSALKSFCSIIRSFYHHVDHHTLRDTMTIFITRHLHLFYVHTRGQHIPGQNHCSHSDNTAVAWM